MENWNKQAEDMIQAWTETQKRMQATWLEAIQSMGTPQSSELWSKAISAWEESVKNLMEAQSRWASSWVNSFTATPNMPKEAVTWAKQGQDIMNQWTESQKHLWEGWLDMVKKMDASQLATVWDKEGAQNWMKTWQEATQKAMNAQAEWIRNWTAAGPSGKTGSK